MNPISAKAADKQMNLKQNEKAPFAGVLVPYDLFRDYQVNDLELNILRKRATDCESSLLEIKQEPNVIQPLWFLGGFLLGAVVLSEARR